MIEETFMEEFLSRTSLYFSKQEIEKVRNTRFAIAGLGGVGAIVAELIARWGVYKIRLFDKDRYETSNLNRQIFATSKTLGQYKVDVATERIKEISPCTEVELVIKERCTYENVCSFLKGSDILIQTTDSPSSLLFYKVARKFSIPLINGYSSPTGGCVCVYDYRTSSCYSLWEKIKDRLKWKGMKKLEEMSKDELDNLDERWGHKISPTINFVTNMVGCLVVAEAIKFITKKGKITKYPYGIEFDLFNCSFKRKNLFSLLNISNYKKFVKILKEKLRS